jgi:metal transporter CNNM
VHKAIRRLTPAPKASLQRRRSEEPTVFQSTDTTVINGADDGSPAESGKRKRGDSTGGGSEALGSSPKTAAFMMRRSSTSAEGNLVKTTVPVRANIREIRQHLRHLGPSNPAINPKGTRSTTVKIKQSMHPTGSSQLRADPKATEIVAEIPREGDDETTPLIRPQLTGADGVTALRQSYGSGSPSASRTQGLEGDENGTASLLIEIEGDNREELQRAAAAITNAGQGDASVPEGEPIPVTAPLAQTGSGSQHGSDQSEPSGAPTPKRHNVRSGSITENIVETRGVRKVVLETTSSNDDEEVALMSSNSPNDVRARSRTSLAVPEEEDDGADGNGEGASAGDGAENGAAGRKKNRRKKRKGGFGS